MTNDERQRVGTRKTASSLKKCTKKTVQRLTWLRNPIFLKIGFLWCLSVQIDFKIAPNLF